MKTLYHVSYQPFSLVKNFTPRIPIQRAIGEDNTIKRVCVSTSVDLCLLASPLTEEMFTPDGYLSTNDIMLYELPEGDFSRYGVPFVLYTFEVDEAMVKTPESIQQYVPDALETNEHWITADAEPVSHRYFLLEDAYKTDGSLRCFYKELSLSELEQLVPLQSDEYSLC